MNDRLLMTPNPLHLKLANVIVVINKVKYCSIYLMCSKCFNVTLNEGKNTILEKKSPLTHAMPNSGPSMAR
jgi:hypothetical protein